MPLRVIVEQNALGVIGFGGSIVKISYTNVFI